MLGLIVLGMGVHAIYQYVALQADADLIEPKRFEEIYMAQKAAHRKLNFVHKSYPIYKRTFTYPHYIKNHKIGRSILMRRILQLGWLCRVLGPVSPNEF